MIFNWLAYLVLEILRWFLILSNVLKLLLLIRIWSGEFHRFLYEFHWFFTKYLNYIYICQRHCEKCYKWRILSVDINVRDWSTGKPPVLYNTDDGLPSDAAAWLTKPTWHPLAADLKIVGTGTTHLMLLSWILSLFVPARRTQCYWHWLLRLYVPTRRLLTLDL